MEWMGEIFKLITAAAFVKMIFGNIFGRVLIVISAAMAWKLSQWHKDPSKEFDWSSVPGYVSAGISLLLLFTGIGFEIFFQLGGK